jgi:hypothetical protein
VDNLMILRKILGIDRKVWRLCKCFEGDALQCFGKTAFHGLYRDMGTKERRFLGASRRKSVTNLSHPGNRANFPQKQRFSARIVAVHGQGLRLSAEKDQT